MYDLDKIKRIDIRYIIQSETRQTFSKNTLPICPFCNSGKGVNGSPAFSINPRKNIFTCFSCNKTGNPIEFIKYLKEFDSKQAIQYLNEKYSSVPLSEPEPEQKIVQDISKTIYAIKHNPIDKATEYLKSRTIQVELLPEQSYFYDVIENAVVFVDSKEKLINKRLINPNSNIKAKFVKGSNIKNAIYDKLFKPDEKEIFIVEGVINAFSIPEKSVIAIFTTSNKLNDQDKIIPYISDKKIVIAFDNDAAGNICSQYYIDLFTRINIPILSIERLIFPLNKDLNDLKKKNGVTPWINDKKNYKEVYEAKNSVDIFSTQAKVEDLYIRVGTDFYMKTERPTAKGTLVPELILWKLSTIRADHGSRQIDKITKFTRFINIPNNTGSYQRILNGCYNLYDPLKHNPQEGECTITIEFIKHIFRDKFSVALDWLTILHRKPNQNLPVICLVSKKQGTGKSTFLKWLYSIYGNNSIILGNEDFQGNFNSHYASKLLICIDETVIEKRLLKEKIKRLATADTINLEAKGRDIVKMDFIGKFILCSNKEDNFIEMEVEDSRFFAIKVEKPEIENHLMLESLEKEIPAYIHFIQTRTIEHKRESRLWFKPDIYRTEALTNIIKSTRSKVEIALIEWFEEVFYFEEVGNSIECTPKLLANEIKDSVKNFSNLSFEIVRILKSQWDLSAKEMKRFTFPCITAFYDLDNEEDSKIRWKKSTGTPYIIEKEFIKQIR